MASFRIIKSAHREYFGLSGPFVEMSKDPIHLLGVSWAPVYTPCQHRMFSITLRKSRSSMGNGKRITYETQRIHANTLGAIVSVIESLITGRNHTKERTESVRLVPG